MATPPTPTLLSALMEKSPAPCLGLPRQAPRLGSKSGVLNPAGVFAARLAFACGRAECGELITMAAPEKVYRSGPRGLKEKGLELLGAVVDPLAGRRDPLVCRDRGGM